jgi:DNA sulfur modification protein DndD
LEAEVDNCSDKIKENELKVSDLKDKRSEKNKESRDIQEKLIKAGSLITVEELQQIRIQEEELNSRQTELQNQLKDSYDIIPFAIAGEKFLEISNQLENESSFKLAKFKDENINEVTNKILTDLIKEPKPTNIVIDYQVERYFAEKFEKLIRKHFFADAPILPEDFKTLQDFSDSERNEFQALFNNIRYSFKESFKRITSEYNLTRNDLNAIRKKIRDAETNQESPMMEEFRRQKENFDKEIIRIDDTIDSLHREIGELNNQKTQNGKHIEELSKKLKVSENNIAKDAVLTKNIGHLKDFIAKFKVQKKKSLETQIFKGLETLLHKKGFVKKVEVELIGETIDILLKNGRDEEIRKESLSKGEQQMYATALLRALVEESGIQFPIFIDSPMQKFDEQHAENIVKYFYPNISEQVVIFPLVNKELTEKEYKILSGNIAKTFLIHNIHEDKSEFMPVDPKDFISTYNLLYHAD